PWNPSGQDDLIGGHSEDRLLHHPLAAPDRQVDAARPVRPFDRDVHGRIAGPDDDHIASVELIAASIVVGVDLVTVEVTRICGVGPTGVPMVPVGDHHVIVMPGFETGLRHDVDVPTAATAAADVCDLSVEGDRVTESEVLHIVAEVGEDLIVAGVVRVMLGHREVRERHARAGGVDLQGLVAGADAVGIVEEPGSADLAALLEAVEGNGRGVEGLRGRDARGPCTDDADLRQGGIRIDGSGDCRCATALSNHVSHATQYRIENLNFHYTEVVDSVPSRKPTSHRWHGTLRAERDSARRTRLLEAALELYGTDGFRRTSVQALCQESGVSSRSFYELFSTQEDVLEQLYIELNAEITTALAQPRVAEGSTLIDAASQIVSAALSPMLRDERKARVLEVESVGISESMEERRRSTMRLLAASV